MAHAGHTDAITIDVLIVANGTFMMAQMMLSKSLAFEFLLGAITERTT